VDAITVAANAAAMGGHRATAIGFVSAFSRLPVHPANTKANNRAMILIRAIPFCQVSKQERRRVWNAIIGIGGWKYDRAKQGKREITPYLCVHLDEER
jgi:CRISPR/Cas system CSM-associated protein Csm4 (group 5 of RAMP superfamily)